MGRECSIGFAELFALAKGRAWTAEEERAFHSLDQESRNAWVSQRAQEAGGVRTEDRVGTDGVLYLAFWIEEKSMKSDANALETSKEALLQQFGASIDMLENAMLACPETLWADRSHRPEIWRLVYHTLFWLDFYLSDTPVGFSPPAPFNLGELDPQGTLPERPYTKEELLAYLVHGRAKCRAAIAALTEETARRRFRFEWMDFTTIELLLYNMRHVQHGAAQLNLIPRQKTDSAPRWVSPTASIVVVMPIAALDTASGNLRLPAKGPR
jgi:hypothetical protein